LYQYLEEQDKYCTDLNNIVEGLARIVPSVRTVEELADADLGNTVTSLIYLIEDVSVFIVNYRSRGAWGKLLCTTCGMILRLIARVVRRSSVVLVGGRWRPREDRGIC
jgi:hypothetical protein